MIYKSPYWCLTSVFLLLTILLKDVHQKVIWTIESTESGEDGVSEPDTDEENDISNAEEWGSGSEVKSESEEEATTAAEALKKLVPYSLDDFEKRVSTDAGSTSESVESKDKSKRPLEESTLTDYYIHLLRTAPTIYIQKQLSRSCTVSTKKEKNTLNTYIKVY